MTPTRFSIRTLPEWARLLLASKDNTIRVLREQIDEMEAKEGLSLYKAEEVLKQYADELNWDKSNTSTSMPDLEDLWEGNSCDGFIIAQDYFKP